MSLGGIPARPGIVIDTNRLNHVVSHNAADMTATFQAGATLQLVEEVLAQEGQILAIDPPIRNRCTVGGTLAVGLSGPAKWHFGHPRDTVIGMKVIQPNGSVTKSGGQVVKNVSGYDMSRLHIGGMGSLGIILETSFKLTPAPMYERTALATFESHESALMAAMSIFNSHAMPLAMTGFDESAASRLDCDPLRRGFHLAVRLGGRPRTLERQFDEVTAACSRAKVTVIERIEGTPANRFWRSAADFGWTPENPALSNIRIMLKPSQIGQMLNALGASEEIATVIDPGFGVVNAVRFAEDDSDASDLVQTVNTVRSAAAALGGTAIVQKCPSSTKRSLDVWGDEPSGISVMRQMKSQYDPNRIMNPGRFVGGI